MWCKKYKNEYAGHDPKRDIRLGYIFINVCTLYDSIEADNLYDVISETEEYQGKIKVILIITFKFNFSIQLFLIVFFNLR